MSTAGETTPLLPNKATSSQDKTRWSWFRALFDVEQRILLAGFLITVSFSFTQVPFYDEHPPYQGSGDRCSRPEIAAGMATQFSILGMTTTLCGTLNLFVAGWMVKRFGARAALLIQTFVPAARVAAQIIGVIAGKRAGMTIIQSTQLITIIGGPAGYILVVNIIAGEIVEPERRTVVFGKLQGCLMLGSALGLLVGGMIGNSIDVRAPFDVAFVSFILSGTFARFAMPYLPPGTTKSNRPTGFGSLFAPLRVLAPQRLRLANGKITKHFGVIFLCAGIFTGVLATDYAPLLMQMYATSAFNFDQGANGWLMSEFFFMRSIFLIFLFPRIINLGRRFIASGQPAAPTLTHAESNGEETEEDSVSSETSTLIPSEPADMQAPTASQIVEEPVRTSKPPQTSTNMRQISHFDLIFLRWSLVVDGAMTMVAAFATQPWHMYLAAFLLPFGSGSAPAAKGVITQMCPESQRADALNAVTLVENMARLSTQGLFGFVFASLASVNKAYATFFCNAAIAVVGMGVLLFSHFPPAESELVEESQSDSGVGAPEEEV